MSPSDDHPVNPFAALDRNKFVPNINALKRVQSLESRKPSLDERPPPPKDGYLGRWTTSRVMSVIVGIVLVLVALHTTGLVFQIALMNHKPVDSVGSQYQRNMGLLIVEVTVFPVLFATILGRFFRAFALYRAQKGITLGNLERCIGSQSIYTAIRTQLAVRPINFVGLSMILLWLLPCFASQSVMRLVHVTDTHIVNDATVKYLHVAQAAQDAVHNRPHAYLPVVRSLFSSAVFFQVALLMHSAVKSAQDFNGYVKIPSVHSLVPAQGGWDPTEWRDIDHSRPTAYSSLMGVPVAGLSNDVNTTFQLASRHWAVECSDITSSVLGPNDFTEKYAWDHQPFVMDLALPDGVKQSQSSWPMRFVSLKGDSFGKGFDTQVENAEDSNASAPMAPINLAYCSIGAQDVISNVSCVSTDCEVESMLLLNEVQRSDTSVPYPPSVDANDGSTYNLKFIKEKDVWNPALWDDDSLDQSLWRDSRHDLPARGRAVTGLRMVLQTLSMAAVFQEEHFPSIKSKNISQAYARYVNGIGATSAELWLNGDNDGYVSTGHYPWPDFSSVPPEVFSSRLEALINTWWQSFFTSTYFGVDLSHDPAFDDLNRLVLKSGNTSTPFNDAAASLTMSTPTYQVTWGFVFVVLGTALIMTFAAVATVVLDVVIIAPNFFGFASTCTRDNIHMPEYVKGSYNDGFQKASELQNVKVRIGDVKMREATGHISLTTDMDTPMALRKRDSITRLVFPFLALCLSIGYWAGWESQLSFPMVAFADATSSLREGLCCHFYLHRKG